MRNPSVSIFCSVCHTKLKRQVIGSNVFYYCRNCGCVISEAYVGETDILNSQKLTSIKGESSHLCFVKVPESYN